MPLLSLLHQLWPDIGVREIAGDSAWDEDAWCKLCELHSGIHPIFRLHPSSGRKLFDRAELGPDATMLGIGGKGEIICAHGQYLDYHSAETPPRPDSLTPGRPHQGIPRFRTRGVCTHGTAVQPACGKVSLRMDLDWSRAAFFPHHGNGHAVRYAHREAMLTRLNQVESFFNHLRTGLKLATRGDDRNRILDKDVQEALVTLGCVAPPRWRSPTSAPSTHRRQRDAPRRAWPRRS